MHKHRYIRQTNKSELYTNRLCMYVCAMLQVQRFFQNLFLEFRLYNLIQMQMIYLFTYKAPMSIYINQNV